ncbi:hypothetical protein GECvBMG_gp272 [Salmonella phage GEC_vB_MG]|nr:hypothetical protein GECvBMG_gp272 [Salmonella phage GEC_vB_MG]
MQPSGSLPTTRHPGLLLAQPKLHSVQVSIIRYGACTDNRIDLNSQE